MGSHLIAQPISDNNGLTTTGNIVTTLTISNFSVPANNNRLLVACTLNASNAAAPTLTFGGNAMASAISRTNTSGLRASMFVLALGNSGTATSGNVVATGTSLLQLGTSSYSNVNQTTPTNNGVSSVITNGSASSDILSVTSSSNDLVCDCIGAFSSGLTNMTASQTQIFQSNASSPNTRLAMSTKTGASSVNMGWSINGDFTGGTSSHVGVNIRSFVLPVELTYFKGQAIKGGNQLLWQTATELNTHGFFIQRSKDGVIWQDVTFVSAKGYSATINNYSWLDKASSIGLNYYRLKQVDMDGGFNYSPIILISDNKTHVLSLYPNPSPDVLYYQYDDPSQITLVQLYDATGKLLQETTSINGQLSLQDLPLGLYLFVLQTENGNLQKRIVKQ